MNPKSISNNYLFRWLNNIFACILFFLISSELVQAQQSSITVISPNGGELVVSGQNIPITWTSSNMSGNIGIELLKNDILVGVIASAVPVANGEYTWSGGRLENGTVVNGTGFKVRVSANIAQEHNIGINLFASQLDFVEDRMFADVMKTARKWVTPGSYGGGSDVSIDNNGWPTVDAETVVWHGMYRMNGTYRLEGESNTQPTISAGFGGADIQNFTYTQGRFSANVIYTSTASNGLLLTFTNTGGGVRNVKLMRPQTAGSSTPYNTSTSFTNQVKSIVSKFKVVRFMWTVDAWNGPWQVAWADRVKPSYCSYNRGANETNIGWAGKGMPWEAAIQFCNETGKDMWLNMPIGANDDYIRQLAILVRDTYSVPNGKVYWEYSNEATWDMIGLCSGYLRSVSVAEANAGGPVGYDGVTDQNVLPNRYYAKRAAEMSLIWRSVWGDAAMMTRVRPVACGQLSYDSELIWGLEFLHNWFNNGDGNHVTTPHPVNYFFYGCGASHYSGDNPDELTGGVSEIATFERSEEEESALSKIFGLTRCAYEGGVWTSEAEYQLPRITEAMVRYHALWNKYDCDLFTYYVSTGGEENGTALGFTMDCSNLDAPKYRALDQILSTPVAQVTAGKIAPCTIEAADFSVNSTVWEHPAAAGAETIGGAQFDEWRMWKGYLFRVSTEGTYSIQLSYNNTIDANIEIMVDGVVITKQLMFGTSSPAFQVHLTPGLHGIRVKKLNSGYFWLNNIQIQ